MSLGPLLAEYRRRHKPPWMSQSQQKRVIAALRASLFKEQLAFVDDPCREKTLCAARRVGKTEVHPRDLYMGAIKLPATQHWYWGITRLRAKQLMWDRLKKCNRWYGIGLDEDKHFNETELTIHLPNESQIRLVGADKLKEAEKKRGDAVHKHIVDESQLYGSFLRPLHEDIIMPMLMDTRGTAVFSGSPGVVKAGYWYELCGVDPNPEKRVRGFTHHSWGPFQNIFLPHLRQELSELKAKRKWADNHPTWLREYCGQWVDDKGALFYTYDSVRNTYDTRAFTPVGPGWQHVLGWDLGKRDAMALVAWGYHPRHENLYEAFSWKESGASTDKVMAIAKGLVAKRGFNIVKYVADTGGLGAVIVDETNKRHSMGWVAAKKTDKFSHVQLMNEDLDAGRIKLAQGSPYAEEIAVLPKDADWLPEEHDGNPAPEDSRFPNHCCDSGLYGWREGYHWLHEEAKKEPEKGTKEYWEAVAKELMEQDEMAVSRDWWET